MQTDPASGTIKIPDFLSQSDLVIANFSTWQVSQPDALPQEPFYIQYTPLSGAERFPGKTIFT